MTTFAQDIEAAAGDEAITAIVVGDFLGWREEHPNGPGTIQTWETARPSLDYEFNKGYGGAECHAIAADTASWVLIVGEYDGATWVQRIPRDPITAAESGVGSVRGG